MREGPRMSEGLRMSSPMQMWKVWTGKVWKVCACVVVPCRISGVDTNCCFCDS